MVYFVILFIATVAVVGVDGFVMVPPLPPVDRSKNTSAGRSLSSELQSSTEGEWVSLAGGVRKRVIEEGNGDVAQEGFEVKVDYVGTLIGETSWTVQDVVDCWLTKQQGLEHLADAFVEAGIDGNKLMDTDIFTEAFVTNELGVSNKIQCKKLVMAAKRIAKQQADFPSGTEFDSSKERGPFKFTLGQGKTIKAYELAVATMKEGERAEIICRSDFAYGTEGYRKQNGDVVVPPFASLCFDIKLLKC